MPLYSFEGKSPSVASDAFIAPTATLIGDVTVEAGASVWYGVVIRADYSPVIVRRGANVQDNSLLHAPPDTPTEIGPGATVAHLCCVHGATIGEEALIANGTTVLDGAKVGARTPRRRALTGRRGCRHPTRRARGRVARGREARDRRHSCGVLGADEPRRLRRSRRPPPQWHPADRLAACPEVTPPS